MSDKTTEQRFWEKVDKSGNCWEWTGAKSDRGYGLFRNGDMERAHRYSYELTYGAIPAGLNVLHHCDNPGCVRPSHLFAGTHQDNADDRERKNRGNKNYEKYLKGEDVHTVKLTEADVKEIRRKVAKWGDQTAIANEYNVTQVTISRIILRKSWKHID